MENIADLLIPEDKSDYKCYELLKETIENDREFCKTILEGIRDKKIRPFDEELLEKLNIINIRGKAKDMDEVLFHGANIGACTSMALHLSFILTGCYRCSGLLPLIKGSLNSPNGEHTWLETINEIYDTSLMLIIDKSYKDKIGYQEEAKMPYELMKFYYEKKDYALDSDLNKNLKQKRK